MAIEAENACFEIMGFGPFPICGPQECFMGPGDDRFCFQQVRACASSSTTSFLPLEIAQSLSSSTASFLPVEIAQSLSCELEKQRVEMDWFLQLENRKLRNSILEEESRGQAVMIQIYESRMKTLILQKDHELALARNRTRELQHLLRGAEMEVGAWERAAREKQAVATDLANRLKQAKERESYDDAVSFCDSSGEGERGMSCKLCRFGRPCVVFFPCRHLCCCKPCESLLEHCPVCRTVKEASLEAFLD